MKTLFVLITFLVLSVPMFGQEAGLYKLPDIMAPHIKAEYTKMCDKGLILYQINCGACHTKTVNGKEVIPDFTPDQISNYELRFLNPKHESEIPETTVSPEELSLIMTFLTYKIKNAQEGSNASK
jgi:hypothetical protein